MGLGLGLGLALGLGLGLALGLGFGLALGLALGLGLGLGLARRHDGHVVTVQRQLRDVRGGGGLGEGSKEVSTGLLIYCTFTVCACLLTS